MAEITFVRVDYRLIHGQVITQWVKQANANNIIIINDELAKDKFMASVYTMAAPPSVKVKVYSIEEASEKYEKDKFGKGKAMILYRSVKDARNSYFAGVEYPSLNVGGVAHEEGKISVLTQVALSLEEYECIKELHEAGVDVNAQVLPNEQKLDFNELTKKMK